MEIFKLSDHVPPQTLSNFYSYMTDCNWNYGIPGGFVTNCPKRKVNAYGNGCAINEKGDLVGYSWPQTFWTAKMSQANIVLETPTQPLPTPLSKLVPTLRELFIKVYPDAQISEHTFSIAVCNNYTEPDMYIAAHTDDNQWYPTECEAGPIFASLTLYPDGQPQELSDYARFQIKRDTTSNWETLFLEHGSVLIMPSGTLHRVQPATRKGRVGFRPRINITFRSTYPLSQNPLMNAMAVANHTRYYRIPKAIHYPETMCEVTLLTIWDAYNQLALAHGSSEVELYPTNVIDRAALKQKYLSITECKRQGRPPMGTNMVSPLIEMAYQYCLAHRDGLPVLFSS